MPPSSNNGLGDAGGGIATPLGMRGRGVLMEVRVLEGEDMLDPVARLIVGFGVANGEAGGRVGDEIDLFMIGLEGIG